MHDNPEIDDLPELSDDGLTVADPTPGICGVIGEYRVLQKIAEGGMGVVYMAQQDAPFHRRVALKVIKGYVNSKQVIARFEAERQALALMEHPNIARIFDAGTTEDGLPYFAMELVKGIPLTEFCDKNRLPIRERLDLFVSVCRAVQHAHLKGIIHRDLKPSNVLVALHDGVPVAKVIDFGLAKATNHQTRLTDKTFFTEFGQIVGTLQYMSPEQAELNQLDVDTRTDVYSLGVMLYELLIGSTPLEQVAMRQNALLKVLDLIREHEPPRPSLRLSASGEAKAEISTQRQIAPEHLHQLLTGELDWIVMKSLEKQRTRRYETAAALADDVLRHLQNETVIARPPTAAYRVSKFIAKNRLLVRSVACILAMLIVGMVATTWQAIRATRAESEARNQQEFATKKAEEAEQRRIEATIARENVTQAKQSAEESAEQAKGILSFVTESFRSADPTRGARKDMSARDVLQHAFDSVTNQVSDPVTQAEVYSTLAQAFLGLGDDTMAIKSAGKAKTLFQQLQFSDKAIANNNRIAEALLARGDAYRAWEVYTVSVTQLLQLNSQGTTLTEDRVELLASNPLTVDALIGVAQAAATPSAEMSPSAAEIAARNAVAAADVLYGDVHPKSVQARIALADALVLQTQVHQATRIYEEMLEKLKSSTDSHPLSSIDVQLSFSRLLADNGETRRAIKHSQEAVDLLMESLGTNHARTARSQCQLAETFAIDGRWDQGIELLEEVHSRFNPQDPSYRQAARRFVRKLMLEDRIELALKICEGSFPDSTWIYLVTENPKAAADILSDRFSNEQDPTQRSHLLKRIIAMLLDSEQYSAVREAIADKIDLLESDRLPGMQTYLALTEMRLSAADGKFELVREQATEFLSLNRQSEPDGNQRNENGDSLAPRATVDQVDREWANGLLALAQSKLAPAESREIVEQALRDAIESFQALHERMPQMPDYQRWTVSRAAEQIAQICDVLANDTLAKEWREKAMEARKEGKTLTLADDWFRTLLDPTPNPNQAIPY